MYVLADCRAKADGLDQIEINGSLAREVSPPLERSASYWNPSTLCGSIPAPRWWWFSIRKRRLSP
jgi:hypothetical protein